MIPDLAIDSVASRPLATSSDLLAEERQHPRVFRAAAERIGLSPAEYREFQRRLLEGDVTYVRLPARLDAMAGDRRGSVYAVHNVQLVHRVMGWRVTLADGAVVYTPATCGNLSLLRPPRVAHVAVAPIVTRRRAGIVAAPRGRKAAVVAAAPAPAPVVVSVDAPAAVLAPVAPVAVAAPAAVAAGGGAGAFIAAPIAFAGGLIYALLPHRSVTTPAAPVPPCAAGSSLLGACQK